MPADLAFRQNWATGSVADGMKGLRRDRHRPFSRHHCANGQPSHFGLSAVQV